MILTASYGVGEMPFEKQKDHYEKRYEHREGRDGLADHRDREAIWKAAATDLLASSALALDC